MPDGVRVLFSLYASALAGVVVATWEPQPDPWRGVLVSLFVATLLFALAPWEPKP